MVKGRISNEGELERTDCEVDVVVSEKTRRRRNQGVKAPQDAWKRRRKQMQAPGGWIARGYPGDEKWEQSSKPES